MKEKSDTNGTESLKLGFTKEQLLRSRQFSLVGKDVLAAVLQEDKRYSIAEVKQLTESWLRKEAK